MVKIAGIFMKAGVIYALIGFAMGIAMGATKNFEMKSAHTHLNLIGWIAMAVYAIYYQLVPEAANMGIAKVHFWLANIGLLVLTVSIILIVKGFEAAETGAAAGSLISLISLMLFVFIVFKTA